jgi:tRNA (guanine37-N1)-methyltransferase
MFTGPMSESIISRGIAKGLVEVKLYDIRDHAHDRHRSVDDYPFGGGYGMLMKPEPLFEAVEAVESAIAERRHPRTEPHLESGAADDQAACQTPPASENIRKVLMTPQGRPFRQAIAEEFAGLDDIIIVCGRYEGVDERVRQHLVTDEISIGDFVLSGGELAAMIVVDAVTRLVPGVVGSLESTEDDSFTTGLLQGPLYTRPAEFRGWRVPDVLLSGNHADIARWRRRESLRRTLERRPDLLKDADLSDIDRAALEEME